LLISGREDSRDDLALYARALNPDAKLTLLDDTADDIFNAFVAPDGRAAIYTAMTGDRPDDVTVRQVRLDGEEPPEDLYEEAMLAAARWQALNPFVDNLSFMGSGQLAQQ
jgi:hypothetical protein